MPKDRLFYGRNSSTANFPPWARYFHAYLIHVKMEPLSPLYTQINLFQLKRHIFQILLTYKKMLQTLTYPMIYRLIIFKINRSKLALSIGLYMQVFMCIIVKPLIVDQGYVVHEAEACMHIGWCIEAAGGCLPRQVHTPGVRGG